MNIREILKQYWGFESFRPLQEDIINSALKGDDTLALLPTGGGKSICFQVPVLAKEGIGVVVSPLIALMKDQVENLNKRGIKAVAVYSGMSKREIDITLDNCAYGNIKFLYVSPERLESNIFKVRIQKMNVNLLAVDEAHCISQWGYDFRPSYLNIKNLRTLLPHIPVLALTATATPKVVEDIQTQLQFKQKNVFQKSFSRSNLAYIVINEQDKYNRLERILNKIQGSSVVYVRNRKRTKEVALELIKRGFSADFYHAGLTHEQRNIKQYNWIHNKTRVIVSTNAFGMGIDKPDVRTVIHLDLPDTLEAYFQEAGRAGRDEKKAYAITLVEEADKINLKQQTEKAYPDKDIIKRVYQAIGNYLQIPDNSGKNETFEIDFSELAHRFKLNYADIFNSLKFLEKQGYLQFNDAVFNPSRVKIIASRTDLYQMQLKYSFIDKTVKALLRMYGGLFEGYVKINEQQIAKQLNVEAAKVEKALRFLHKSDLIDYLPATNKPTVTYLQEKVPMSHFHLAKENYIFLKKRALEKMQYVLDYVNDSATCRSVKLLAYFGEKNASPCGICDVCIENSRKTTTTELEELKNQILNLLSIKPLTLKEIVQQLPQHNENHIIEIINWLTDNNRLFKNDKQVFYTKNK
jgi:ATP-dependent DNA helicase RecQ